MLAPPVLELLKRAEVLFNVEVHVVLALLLPLAHAEVLALVDFLVLVELGVAKQGLWKVHFQDIQEPGLHLSVVLPLPHVPYK